MSFFQVTGFDLSRVIGDLGDSRFIMAITEYNYQWAIGIFENYWDGFFFYPDQEVISYSDNLLGILPFYFPIRLLTGDMHLAFQLLMLVVHVLNFFSAYWCFRKLSSHHQAAAIGAFVFTFSMALNGIHNHPQFSFRFCIPVFMFFLHRSLSHQSFKDLLICVALLSWQIYLGVYVGTFLLLLGGAYAFIYMSFHYRSRKAFTTAGTHFLFAGTLLALSLLPLLLFYYKRMESTGFYSSYDFYMQTVPRPASYFKSFPGSGLWSSISATEVKSDYPYLHFLFPGAMVILSIVYTIYLATQGDRVALISICTLALLILFTTYYEGHTLYGYLMKIPGVKSARVVARIITVELFLFGWLACLSVRHITEKSKGLEAWIGLALASLFITDNFCNDSGYKTYTVKDSQNRINQLSQKLDALGTDAKKSAFAYLIKGNDSVQFYHLDAMLCALKRGVKTVNGYSSSCHKAYGPFWREPDSLSLMQWSKAMNFDPGQISIVR